MEPQNLEHVSRRPIMELYFSQFKNALFNLTDLLLLISSNVPKSSTDEQLNIAHQVLQKHCVRIKTDFSSDKFNCGDVIKKICKLISANLNLFYPIPNKQLFQLRNEDNKLITLIPGLNINLIFDLLNEDELNKLWCSIYTLYICSIELLFNKSENRKKMPLALYKKLPKLYSKLNEMNGSIILFNIYDGIGDENDIMDIDNLFLTFTNNNLGNSDISNMLSNISLDSMGPLYKMLKTNLQDIPQSELDNISKSISQLLGTSNDVEMNNLFSKMINNLSSEIKKSDNLDFNSLCKNMMENMDPDTTHHLKHNAQNILPKLMPFMMNMNMNGLPDLSKLQTTLTSENIVDVRKPR